MQLGKNDFRQHFYALADHVQSQLATGEGYTLWLAGEDTDFVRFNHGRVRQAGAVAQAYLTVQWVHGQRHISEVVALAGNRGDRELVTGIVKSLRAAVADVTDDPHLLLADEVRSTERLEIHALAPTESIVGDIVDLAGDSDIVGILAAGPVFYGFANHHGQRNWHESASWNFDWSLYSHGDKAVKRGSAGVAWNRAELAAEMTDARAQAVMLGRAPRELAPGGYRTYFTPAALGELVGMMNWGGFSEKQLRTKRSGLIKLALGEAGLSPMFNLIEDTQGGLAPAFQAEGFIKPAQIELVRGGRFAGSLISPRTAKEYGIQTNGAGGGEALDSMSLAPGGLAAAAALKALDTGLYVSNLWYLNFSDRAAGRLTGMTRFACFWVEGGEIVAPLNVMRFDDTFYRVLGSELEALTAETSFLADPGSYGARTCSSQRLPGALVRELRLVL